MTLTKNRMVREIGRRTRLKNRDIQAVLETLVEVWTEELVNGGRIELENFIVLETKTIDRGEHVGILKNKSRELSPTGLNNQFKYYLRISVFGSSLTGAGEY